MRLKILAIDSGRYSDILDDSDVIVSCEFNDKEWMAVVEFGQECPDGRFNEAINTFGEVLYVSKLPPEQRAELSPVVDAAREWRQGTKP